jgi:hypothetical protein
MGPKEGPTPRRTGRLTVGFVDRKVMRLFSFNHEFYSSLQNKVIAFKIVPLGSYTATEALFPMFVAVLEYLSARQSRSTGYYPKFRKGALSSGF